MLRLKYERVQRGLSQRTVGIASRIPQPTLAFIENGRFLPYPDQLQRLSNFFNVPVEELLKDVEIVTSTAMVEERV